MPTLRASVELLQKIPIFASLTEDELKTIVDSPDNGIMNFKPLEAIIEEDEFGDCMYIILEGAVDMPIENGKVRGDTAYERFGVRLNPGFRGESFPERFEGVLPVVAGQLDAVEKLYGAFARPATGVRTGHR